MESKCCVGWTYSTLSAIVLASDFYSIAIARWFWCSRGDQYCNMNYVKQHIPLSYLIPIPTESKTLKSLFWCLLGAWPPLFLSAHSHLFSGRIWVDWPSFTRNTMSSFFSFFLFPNAIYISPSSWWLPLCVCVSHCQVIQEILKKKYLLSYSLLLSTDSKHWSLKLETLGLDLGEWFSETEVILNFWKLSRWFWCAAMVGK